MLLFAASIGLSACTSVLFTEPQPAGVSNEKRFPEELLGTYAGKSDDTIIVRQTSYLRNEEKDTYALKSQLDGKTLFIKNGLIYDLSEDAKNGFPYTENQDTLSYHIHRYQEVGLSDSVVLRRYQGYYFLSLKGDHDLWQTMILSKSKSNRLTSRMIDGENEKEVAALKEVMQVETVLNSDSTVNYYYATPTPQELMDFIQGGGFTSEVFRMQKIR
ncbi:MAG: hypothetical protein EAZ89_12085 [Bacteroidetes bacterium]|nr:MAG: hypothetical protein EAZ89_12085 [Bacteroidota bacterium]